MALFFTIAGKNGSTAKSIPLVICGDLNSLPDSGVVEFLEKGRIPIDHSDFQDMQYEGFLSRLSSAKGGEKCAELKHSFKLRRAYAEEQLPYTNLTYHFQGIIDYIYYTTELLMPLGVLGAVSEQYIKENRISGWPHPHFPSDHQGLLAEFEAVGNGVSAYGYGFGPQQMPR